MGRLRLALLTMRLHLDGLRVAPRTYMIGLWWYLTGKRLRARGRLSPLLGQSPRAYQLWLARRPAGQKLAAAPEQLSVITVIVDARAAGLEAVSATLSSLEKLDDILIFDPDGILDPDVSVARICTSLSEMSQAIDWGRAWLLPLYAGDTLAPGAESSYAMAVAYANTRVIYADDDLLSPAGKYREPHFKPEWNVELFRYADYLSGAALMKVDRESLAAAAKDSDWIKRLATDMARTCEPEHLPMLLHHRRKRFAPVVPARGPAASSGEWPAVSVIIPTRNGTELLRTCLDGLVKTDYPNLETIIVDNDSDDREAIEFLESINNDGKIVIKYGGAFNYSSINNYAVSQSHNPVLCFLNNDIEMTDDDWLKMLVGHAMRDEVGAIGPMLLYPDGSIQHAGVVLGVGGGAGHAHRYLLPEDEGYFRRHVLPQYVSAVTGACLVVTRDCFDAAGGFDEVNFPVAFNDVDLCLKLTRLGFRSLYEPRARLIHHESKSRGNDRDKKGAARLARELQALKDKWHTDRIGDPYHHANLSKYSERFVVDI